MMTTFQQRGFGPTANDYIHDDVGMWQSVNICENCKMVCTSYTNHTINPCKLCSGKLGGQFTAKWIKQERSFPLFGKVTQQSGWLVKLDDDGFARSNMTGVKPIDFNEGAEQ